MDGFLFCFVCLFICFCAWHALQVRASRVLVSTLTNRGPQAGAGIQLGHRHCLATCWFLCGSLCVATRKLQGNSGPMLFRYLFMLALHSGQTCCPSLQVWYCTCVSSEMRASRLFGGVSSTIPEAFVSLAASSPALWAESSWCCCPAVGLGSLCPAKVLGCCSPEVFPSDGVRPAIPPSVWLWN